jgi:hypothetical protein
MNRATCVDNYKLSRKAVTQRGRTDLASVVKSWACCPARLRLATALPRKLQARD